jgi:uncharacterized repeat protein (TIGR01451 family)
MNLLGLLRRKGNMHEGDGSAGRVRACFLTALAVGLLALAAPSGVGAAVGTTFAVDTTDGTTDGVCGGASDCSLGDAIQAANANAGTDRVAFALPVPPYTIQIDASSPLPDITDPVVIDGTTQPGWIAAPIVEVRGTASATLLTVRAGPSSVRGLVINRYATGISIVGGSGHRISGNYIGTDATGSVAAGGSQGISTFASGTVIGGASPLDRNVISGNSAQNVLIQESGATVKGNYVGTDASGEVALGGGTGILTLNSGDHEIGGAGPGEGNLVSGHGGIGISVGGARSAGHRIIGNRVGTDKDGLEPLPNLDGMHVSGEGFVVSENLISANRDGGLDIGGCIVGDCLGTRVVQANLIGVDVTGTKALGNGTYGISTGVVDGLLIGGSTPGQGNVIAANGGNSASGGILFFNSARRHLIQGNLIGVGRDGTPLGNLGYGIRCCGAFAESRDNVIGGTAPGEGNLIAYNTWDGVRVTGASPSGTHVSIVGNTIHSNGRLGIDLDLFGPTINDPMDVDEGSNDLQNFPVITRVTNSGGQTLAEVEFGSTSETDFRLEFFRNTSCNQPTTLSPSSWFGEGQTLVGAQQVTTDSAGNWSGTVTLSGETAVTEVITSTATRFTEPGATLVGATSEFSECLADLSITKTDEPDPVAVDQPLTYTIDVINDGPAPATSVTVTDSLPSGVTVTSITSSQGTCSQSGSTVTCLLGLIARDGTARITIIVNPGSTPRAITNATNVSSEPRDPDGSDNSASTTTQVVSGATIIVEKQTEPDGSSQPFSFSGAITASLSDGLSASRTVAAGTYTVSEVVPPGWDTTVIRCEDPTGDSSGSGVPVSPGGTASATFRVAAGESVTCTFTNTRRGEIIVEKQTNPDGAAGSFTFTGTAAGTITGGAQIKAGDLVPGMYTSVENNPTPSFDLTAIDCDDAASATPSTYSIATRTATFKVDPGETVTCTFTNTKRGSVTLRKTTNGVVDPSKDILFVLTGAGLPTAGLLRSTSGDQDGVLEWPNLLPAQYTVCETPVPAGFTSFWKLDAAVVTPYNPDAAQTPPEDLGARCYDFSLAAGQERAFEVDNSRPGGDPRTIGYWKNWNRCTSGNQAATAQKNGGAAAGFFLIDDLLPQLVGDFSVTSCSHAVSLLSKQDKNGKNKGSDAAYELGAQLLAARFNLAAGAETCLQVQQAVLDSQTLLDGINFTGSNDYLGSKSKDPKRSQALALAASIDRYNNGNLC